MISQPAIWLLNAEEVYASLGTSPQGMADSEAEIKLKQYGANELPDTRSQADTQSRQSFLKGDGSHMGRSTI